MASSTLGTIWQASAALPYEDPRSAIAGLRAELRTRGQRGLALLQFGLAGYAKRR